MANNKHYTVVFRRKREQKTDYKRRLSLLKSRKPRMVIRKGTSNIMAQIVEYLPDGDKVIARASSFDLKKFGLPVVNNNEAVCYLTGHLLAKKANTKDEIIVDLGLQKANSKLYAVIKGAVDAGMNIAHSDDILPADDRVNGVHIEKYAQALKDNEDAYKKQFSAYIKEKIDPTSISKTYACVKEAIQK